MSRHDHPSQRHAGAASRALLATVASSIVLAACAGTLTEDHGRSATVPARSASATLAADRASSDTANRYLASRARETGRDGVAICLYVDPRSGQNAESARLALQGSVDALVQQGYSALSAQPVATCPHAPLFLLTNTVHPTNSGGGPVAPPPRVTTPSPFLLFVVETMPATIAAIFGGLTTRRGSEEFTCSGDSCAEVTSSVYAASLEFADASTRERLILAGLGLLGR